MANAATNLERGARFHRLVPAERPCGRHDLGPVACAAADQRDQLLVVGLGGGLVAELLGGLAAPA